MRNKTRYLLAFCLLMVSACLQPRIEVEAQSSTCPIEGCKVFLPILSSGALGDRPPKICLVTDTGGINDGSFNASTWQGALDANRDFEVSVEYLVSQNVEDYPKNIERFMTKGCNLILTVGFMQAESTLAAALAHPSQKFSIVDVAFDPILENIVSQSFSVDQSAFLSGYLAAGMTRTGKVGTFGGYPIPSVTIFMDGFARGVDYYNQQKGTSVEVYGWDISNPDQGLYTSSFDDQRKAWELAYSLMDEAADIILPVAGPASLGALQAVKEHGNAFIIGVDSDWALTNSDFADIILTSILKIPRGTTYGVIRNLYDNQFVGGTFTGTLANQGVGLGTVHSSVPSELLVEVEQVKAGIISGTIVTTPN